MCFLHHFLFRVGFPHLRMRCYITTRCKMLGSFSMARFWMLRGGFLCTQVGADGYVGSCWILSLLTKYSCKCNCIWTCIYNSFLVQFRYLVWWYFEVCYQYWSKIDWTKNGQHLRFDSEIDAVLALADTRSHEFWARNETMFQQVSWNARKVADRLKKGFAGKHADAEHVESSSYRQNLCG